MTAYTVKTDFTGDDKVSAMMGQIAGKADAFGTRMEKRLNAISGGMSKVKSAFASVAVPMAIAGAGIGFLGKQVISAGGDFEEAITAVGAVGLQTRDQIADLEAEAKRLGATTKFTATESANAMEIMARAGFSNAEILGGVGGVLNAAAASGLEMAEVANHVSNVLKGMGLETAEAGRVADVLTLASSKTNSSIGSLGESMKNLSPVAKQFGISLEDSVGMVALLQDVGLDASEAGTATATMLTKLTKPTSDVTNKMKEMGVTFQDAHGNMLPPLEIFSNMSKAADALGGNMDQVAFFADLVGLRGQKAALNLKDLFTSDKGQQLAASLIDASGSAEKMANLRMQNLKGDMTLLGSAVDAVKVELFDMNSGPLRGIIQATTEWVDQNKEMVATKVGNFLGDILRKLPLIITWVQRIAYGIAIFKGMEIAVGGAKAALAIYSGIMSMVATKTAAAAGSTVALEGATAAAKVQMGLFNVVAAVNPMVWIFGAIAAVALLAANWDTATNSVADYLDMLPEALGGLSDEKLAAKKAAFASGALLRTEDRSGIDGKAMEGTLEGEMAKIFKRADELATKMQKNSDAIGRGESVETSAGGGGAAAMPMNSEQSLNAALGFGGARQDDPFAIFRENARGPEEGARRPDAKAEITIRDETGRAEVTAKPNPKSGADLKLKNSGTP